MGPPERARAERVGADTGGGEPGGGAAGAGGREGGRQREGGGGGVSGDGPGAVEGEAAGGATRGPRALKPRPGVRRLRRRGAGGSRWRRRLRGRLKGIVRATAPTSLAPRGEVGAGVAQALGADRPAVVANEGMIRPRAKNHRGRGGMRDGETGGAIQREGSSGISDLPGEVTRRLGAKRGLRRRWKAKAGGDDSRRRPWGWGVRLVSRCEQPRSTAG